MTHARARAKPENADHVTIRRIYHVLREKGDYFEFADDKGVRVWIAWSDKRFNWEKINLPQ